MNERKRIRLTHGSAMVAKDCSDEMIAALNQLSVLSYEQLSCVDCKYYEPEILSKCCVCVNKDKHVKAI